MDDSRIRILRGPKENLHRPAIDVLFRSAAIACGRRVIGVLMTGGDDDGAAGLKAIQESGGIVIVQDPGDSMHPEMPQSALNVLEPDYVLPLCEIGPMVRDLVTGVVQPERRSKMSEPIEKSIADDIGLPRPEDPHKGDPSVAPPNGVATAFSCPECNGTLWEVEDGQLLRYRCRVGHAYTSHSVMEAEAEAADRAIWEAIRVFDCLLKRADEREQYVRVLRNLEVNEPDAA